MHLLSFKLGRAGGRLSELDVSRQISRVASSRDDVTGVIEAIAKLALQVGGVKGLQIEYKDPHDGKPGEALAWGNAGKDGAIASAAANISAGGRSWGELRLYFELDPSVLESPLRFAKFLAQQIGLQLSRRSLHLRADTLKQRIEQLRKIVEKRKAIQRARAILANTKRIDDAEALELMRQYSRESGRTMHEVAEALIFSEAGKWAGDRRYVERPRSPRLLARRAAGGGAY